MNVEFNHLKASLLGFYELLWVQSSERNSCLLYTKDTVYAAASSVYYWKMISSLGQCWLFVYRLNDTKDGKRGIGSPINPFNLSALFLTKLKTIRKKVPKDNDINLLWARWVEFLAQSLYMWSDLAKDFDQEMYFVLRIMLTQHGRVM